MINSRTIVKNKRTINFYSDQKSFSSFESPEATIYYHSSFYKSFIVASLIVKIKRQKSCLSMIQQKQSPL